MSSRPSSAAPLSSSTIPATIRSLAHTSDYSSQLTSTHIRLLEKQQEHAGLQALKEASGSLLERVEELAKMGNVMADGGEAVGSVLRNWPHVFSILNLFPTPVPPPTTFDSPEDPLNPSSTSSSNGNGNGNLNLAGNRGADDEALAEREKSLPQLVRLQFGDGE